LIEWIKTEENLPPEEEDVLIFDTSDNLSYIVYLTASDNDDKLVWMEASAGSPCSWKLEDIKHWAVLTPPED
jgi:hypothetical protein